MVAAKQGDSTMVKLLLENGAASTKSIKSNARPVYDHDGDYRYGPRRVNHIGNQGSAQRSSVRTNTSCPFDCDAGERGALVLMRGGSTQVGQGGG